MTVAPLHPVLSEDPAAWPTLTADEARIACRRLARSHYENFPVLTRLVPADRRDDFAAVYAFCRWADDLGDEAGATDRASELLAWFRKELHEAFEGRSNHPLFIALKPTVDRLDLPREPFDDLITAFEQDQTLTRYDTWEQLLGYCRNSANPVGRLVLMLMEEPRTDDLFARSDDICTALQLTNHWQDVARDVIERDRIYIPRELNAIDRFEERLLPSARQGYAVDQQFLGETRTVIRELVERTWDLYERGAPLLAQVSERSRPIIWLFTTGGQHVLRSIEMWNYETVLHRPKLGKATKVLLVGRAMLMRSRLGSRMNGRAGEAALRHETATLQRDMATPAEPVAEPAIVADPGPEGDGSAGRGGEE